MNLSLLQPREGGREWHPALGEVRYRVTELGWDPDEQVRRTLGIMRERVAEDAADPGFQARTKEMFDSSAYSEVPLVEQVWSHAQRGITFKRDEAIGMGVGGHEEVVEAIIRPKDMARYVDGGMAIGDCDDFSMYAACLLKCLNIPCEFVTVAANGDVPDQFSHVYVVAYPRNENGERMRMAVDASHGEYPGWEVPNRFGKMAAVGIVDQVGLFVGGTMLRVALWAGIWFGAKWAWRQLRGRTAA